MEKGELNRILGQYFYNYSPAASSQLFSHSSFLKKPYQSVLVSSFYSLSLSLAMGRSPCCDKAIVKRGPWSPEEDETLKDYIKRHGTVGNWIALPKKAGLNRCGKSCRLRWLNYLRPDIKHGGFTEDEDSIIWALYNKIGSRWSVIASQLPGRTDNDVKNYWNTKLKKRLKARQNNTQISINSSAVSTSDVSFTDANSTISTLINIPSPPPLIIPTVKTENYTCDDFLAPTLASTSYDGLGFGHLGFNQESLLVENSCGFFSDELLISSFYETKPHGYS
ncbi:hypothetical protein LUZ60_009321 [Juncus effusus]|nr:hypothetical protein LUZ60_009321 [Juncus effusus]